MRLLKILLATIIALGIFALTYKGLITLGTILLEKSTIDLTTEFGHNMIAMNTLISFVTSIFLAIKIFKKIKGK